MKTTRNICKWGLAFLGIIFQIQLHGCATLPVSAPTKDIVIKKTPISGPSSNLVQDAKHEMQAGRFDKAEMITERALRMEPHNAGIWQLMGRIKAARNNHSEAIQFYKKSNSLAGIDAELSQQNQLLIEAAQRAKEKGSDAR